MLSSWLSQSDNSRVKATSYTFRHWRLCSDLPVHPLVPFAARTGGKLSGGLVHSRYRDRGHPRVGLSTSHTTPVGVLLIQYAWPWLSVRERHQLIHSDLLGIHKLHFKGYLGLRRHAIAHRHTLMQLPHVSAATYPTELSESRAITMGAALICFGFEHGDLVRWLGGDYTHQHRVDDGDFSRLEQKIRNTRDTPQTPTEPTPDFERAFAVLLHGAPLAGTFSCTPGDLLARLLYDNHPPLTDVLPDVRAKFAAEAAKGFHVIYPKCLALFIPGLMLSPLSWVVQKGKGRIIVDCSTKIADGDSGAPNSYIPSAGRPGTDPDACPPCQFGDALMRILIRLWNLRISHPHGDILQHADDISSAFRQILYHPDIAVAFAQVLGNYLVVPVGLIFGSKSSPSFFDLTANVRTFLGNICDYSREALPLAGSLQLIAPPTPEESDNFPTAVADSQNPGSASSPFPGRHHHIMYVDDNHTAALRESMIAAVRAAEGSAYDVYGKPVQRSLRPCFQADKWDVFIHYLITHLGYDINTRAMTMAWPIDKRTALASHIDAHFNAFPCMASPQFVARLLGQVRNGSIVSPHGEFLSVRLSQDLAHLVKAIPHRKTHCVKRWWRNHAISIAPDTFRDIQLLRTTLLPQHAALWTRPIGLLVPRDPTSEVFSDACYEAIGGYSRDWGFCWRLRREALITAGFDMKLLEADGEPSLAADNAGLHINVLEFLAVIVNLWLTLKLVKAQNVVPPGGHVISVRCDNTSAVSWLRYAARAHSPVVRTLAYIAQRIICLSQTSDVVRIATSHIKGSDNTIADAMSRPQLHGSLGCAIRFFSLEGICSVYLIHFKLLSLIATAISSTSTGARFEEAMTALLNHEPRILSDGSVESNVLPGFYGKHRRR